MNPETIKVVEEIGREIIRLAELILENDSISANRKTGKNSLKDSMLKKSIHSSITIGGNIVIETFFNNYVEYIEKGRTPGKMPPISALREWAIARNIPGNNSTLYAIANAIKRDGYKGRPILATLEREIENHFENEWYDRLFEAMTNELTKYFDN